MEMSICRPIKAVHLMARLEHFILEVIRHNMKFGMNFHTIYNIRSLGKRHIPIYRVLTDQCLWMT
ncbi:hypothetical protein GGC63_006240 [Paenibacillus sp. OAS669]|nr:hypothetical protein [Paenibacillus sp. OAS669]